ncbi:unnamed protein product [Dovyalis caffra]|uniref:Disease resistance RPP13-like protein 4 n=1 Tax=Dovyalis caffra TaxID=77055 RepID=A0AAV1SJ87_9ROSI|nr:unnamed protein product [Dovyalis caffra]
MSSSISSSAQRNLSSSNALTIQEIIKSIPDLIDIVSEAKASIPLPPQSNTDNTPAAAAVSSSSSTTITTPAASSSSTTTTSNVNDNDNSQHVADNDENTSSNTTTSPPTPDSSNNGAAADASTPAPAPALVSSSASVSTSAFASTSASAAASASTIATTTNVGGNNDTTTSNNAYIKDEISDGSCWMLGFSNKNPTDANKKKDNNFTVNVGNEGSVNSDHEINQKLHNQLEKLTRDLKYIQSACDKLKQLELHVGAQFKSLQDQSASLQDVVQNIKGKSVTTGNHTILTKRLQHNIKLIAGMVVELKHDIPSPYKLNLANEGHKKSQNVSGGDFLNLIDEMLKIRDNKAFEGCSSFEDFKENYKSLDLRDKLCLLCFAVFPENAVIKKRLLMYWWVGEGFIDGDNPEEVADEILKKFLEKGFVEPEIKKRRLVGFRMRSLIRYAVIVVAAKVGFFHFDSMGNPTADFLSSQRACLIKTGDKYSRQVLPDMESKLEKLHAVFNVNDPYPDLKTELFSRMRNINVLCLGRWEDSSKKHNEAEETKHHVEVDSTEFLKGLRNMKHLKFLSLQGISRINELPETIQKLVNLRILDLNACHNLETIPENIFSLQKLTHLDISECYMLDFVPKGLGSLTELRVLKGFVISDLKIKTAGTLDDLKGLIKLRKLSIYTTKKDFPSFHDLGALRRIATLRKLTIAWGGKSQAKKKPNQSDEPNQSNEPNRSFERKPSISRRLTRSTGSRQDNPDLPKDLLKLDLQCYPETKAPLWLSPGRLKNLKKLYIRGGHLNDLGDQVGDVKWNVKILRLKFLQELKMNWIVLNGAFPQLVYLEKFNCPKLSFFPCDGSGVWLDREKLARQPLEELELTWSFLSKRST